MHGDVTLHARETSAIAYLFSEPSAASSRESDEALDEIVVPMDKNTESLRRPNKFAK